MSNFSLVRESKVLGTVQESLEIRLRYVYQRLMITGFEIDVGLGL